MDVRLSDIHRTSVEKPSHAIPDARQVKQDGRIWSHLIWRLRHVLQPPNACVRRALALPEAFEVDLEVFMVVPRNLQ